MSKRDKKAGMQRPQTSTAAPAAARPSPVLQSISIEQMLSIEKAVVDEVLIVAEDSVVRKLVSQAFPVVTLSNLRRGVRYRFLVSARSEEEMRAFLLKARDALKDPGAEGRLEFHCLDDDVFRLIMPGSIFDSYYSDRHVAYCRLPTAGSYTWFQLSESHRDGYTTGFAGFWKSYVSSSGLQVLAAEWRFLARVVLPGLVLAGLSVFAIHKLVHQFSGMALRKFVVGEAMGALAVWIVACVGIGQLDSVLAGSSRFRAFKRVATFVLVTIIIATVVNVFSNWLAT